MKKSEEAIPAEQAAAIPVHVQIISKPVLDLFSDWIFRTPDGPE